MNFSELESKKGSLRDVLESVIAESKKSGIDNVEIFCSYVNGQEISLEKNDINTSTSMEETTYGIRVIDSGCQGFVSTNDRDTLLQSVKDARAIARSLNTPDAALALPEAAVITPVASACRKELDDTSFDDLLLSVQELLQYKNSEFPKVNIDSGEFDITRGFKMIASSKGVYADESGGSVSGSFMGMAVDGPRVGGFDYDYATGHTLAEFQANIKPAFEKFLKQCMSTLDAQNIESFRGSLLLPPRIAAGFLLGDLLGSITAPMIRKGKSRFGDKLHTRIASELLTVTDNPRIDHYSATTSFDREGQPTREMSILNGGVLENYYYNFFESNKASVPFQGGFASGGAAALPSCGPRQIQIAAGNSALSDMTGRDNTILMHRFSGSTDASSGDFSGVVKGGFLLQNGKKTPVREIQIAGNIYEALNNISAVSSERELVHSSSMIPWIMLDNIDITGS